MHCSTPACKSGINLAALWVVTIVSQTRSDATTRDGSALTVDLGLDTVVFCKRSIVPAEICNVEGLPGQHGHLSIREDPR